MNPQPGWGSGAWGWPACRGPCTCSLLACFHSRDHQRPGIWPPSVLTSVAGKAGKAKNKKKLWQKPQPWSFKSHSISQDELGYAAVTNTYPAPDLRDFQEQSWFFTHGSCPERGGDTSVQHGHPRDPFTETPSHRGREESIAHYESPQHFCSK